MRRSLSAALVCAAIPAAPAHAAWKPIGPPGVSVNAIVIDSKSPKTIYVGTQDGIFKSTDGAETWVMSSKGLDGTVESLAMDPVNARVLYAGPYRGGLHKSTDGGATWTQLRSKSSQYDVSGRLAMEALAVDPHNGKGILFGSFFRSVDGGLDWKELSPDAFPCGARDLKAVAYDPKTPKTVLAGGTGALCRSTDAGVTWTKVDLGVPEPMHVRTIAFHPKEAGTVFVGSNYTGLFKSADGGKTWKAGGTGLSSKRVTAIALHPQDPRRMYVAAGAEPTGDVSSIFASADGGASFQDISGDLQWVGVNALAVDPAQPDTVYAALDHSGVAVSRDGGKTWEEKNQGFPVVNRRTVTALAPTPAGGLVAAVYGAILRTDDGRNWTRLRAPLSRGLEIEHLAAAGDPLVIVAGSDDGPALWSRDGGANWSSMAGGLQCAVPDPKDARSAFVCKGGGGAYRLMGGGQMPLGEDLTATLVALAVDPANPQNMIALQRGGGLYKTTNGGKKWKEHNKGVRTKKGGLMGFDEHRKMHTLFWDKSGLIAATDEEGVMRSTDGGETWSVVGLAGEKVTAFTVDGADARRMAAATKDKGVMVSADGGATWAAQAAGLPEKKTITAVVYAGGKLHASSQHGGVFVLE